MFEKQALLKMTNQPEEKLLLAKVLDQADLSLQRHEKCFTDFIDPKKSELVFAMVQKIKDLNVSAFGGDELCERQMLGFSPDYVELTESEFPISAVKINFNKKFSSALGHRDYLGSILGLGITRDKLGDIRIYDDFTICYVHSEIADYISNNLDKVGRTKVSAEVLKVVSLELPKENIEQKHLTVSALRLDCILASAFHLSRGKAQDLIEGEKAFVNWTVQKNASHLLKEGDMLSLRGFGRAKMGEIKGKTKKDRIGIVIFKYL